MTPARDEARCRATKDAGEPCGASPQLIGEDGFCPAHRPGARERLSEAGRKGAEALRDKYRRKNVQADTWALETPADAQEWLKQIGMAVLAGKITHGQADATTRAVRAWLLAHDAGTISDRLKELRAMVAELKGDRKLRSVK